MISFVNWKTNMSSAIETKLSQLDVDKSDWMPVKFGDITFEPKETVKDALKEGIEHVVGLEHIQTGDIHLRNSNGIEQSTTFTKKFSPNDLLFGRRRAYLKKAAQAQFTGICSGDIIVMRAKYDLMPELLPFIVNNDKFIDWAIQHSAGGLSPRCKFKDLANYEFLLPPKAQQAVIAKLLWSLDDVIEKNFQTLDTLKIYRKCFYKTLTKETNKFGVHKIKDLMNFNYGKGLKESDRVKGKFAVVSSSGIKGYHHKALVQGPGIVVGRKGNVGQVTWVDNDFWPIDTAYYITLKKEYKHISLKFFYYMLKSINLAKYSIATAVPGLNRDDALLTKAYMPNDDEIEIYLRKFDKIYNQISELNALIKALRILQKSLVSKVF